MAITYPLTSPSELVFRNARFRARNVVGKSESPFTFETQIYVHQGEAWMVDVDIPPQLIGDGEALVCFGLSLNGTQGTFLMPPPGNTNGVRGTWAGSPKVLGAHAARSRSIAMDGFTPGATVFAGDWIQVGTGSSTRLYKVIQTATANGSGLLTLEIWPGLRAAMADNDTFTIVNPKGLWRLAQMVEWDIGPSWWLYGLQFSIIEAL